MTVSQQQVIFDLSLLHHFLFLDNSNKLQQHVELKDVSLVVVDETMFGLCLAGSRSTSHRSEETFGPESSRGQQQVQLCGRF